MNTMYPALEEIAAKVDADRKAKGKPPYRPRTPKEAKARLQAISDLVQLWGEERVKAEAAADARQRAEQASYAADWRVEQKIQALHKHRVARALNCGKGASIHLRRKTEDGRI
jgi:hypothetical protein